MPAPRKIIDKHEILDILQATNRNKFQTANKLKIHRQTLDRLLEDYAIEFPEPPPPGEEDEEEADGKVGS